MLYSRFLPTSLLIASLFVPALAFAQGPSFLNGGPSAPAKPANTVDCFDYYQFGSVQAKLVSSVASTVSGADMTFSGSLENANPYPIVDGALYVKVFKSRGAENDGNGPDVVDQFQVKDGITIPAHGSIPISFSWHAPSYAQSGEYELATFFTVAHKFNLLGLTFTDDIVGNTVPFRVVGEQSSGVQFNKTAVTVNGGGYHFASAAARVPASEPVVVQAAVLNTTNVAQQARISWTVHYWDGQLRENMVQEEQEALTIPPHSSAPVSIIVRDTKYPVYLVIGTLAWNDTKSVINVRFARDGRDRMRINFPGIMSFPLKAGEQTTLFSCLHNAGSSARVSHARLTLSLIDGNGKILHSYEYKGDVTGAMMGVAEPFIPKRTYDKFSIEAKLYQNNILVDQSSTTYDCRTINKKLCKESPLSTRATLALFGSIVLILLIGFIMYRKKVGLPDHP